MFVRRVHGRTGFLSWVFEYYHYLFRWRRKEFLNRRYILLYCTSVNVCTKQHSTPMLKVSNFRFFGELSEIGKKESRYFSTVNNVDSSTRYTATLFIWTSSGWKKSAKIPKFLTINKIEIYISWIYPSLHPRIYLWRVSTSCWMHSIFIIQIKNCKIYQLFLKFRKYKYGQYLISRCARKCTSSPGIFIMGKKSLKLMQFTLK